ncbi:50S ribosomal protein L32e [Candidatus Nanohalococcus occultus]|uniref:50S ribosomal protein L32e n=1 Tax=Candidatus Nanohalococcus occultus TaxID=2978047 RepID=UPI0039E0FD5C
MKDFKREDAHKHKRVSSGSWRSPNGTHSDIRREVKGAAPKPKAGRRTDKDVRGKHPSGYDEVLVNRPVELEDIDPETEAVRVSGTVGGKKKAQILEKADELELKVLNRGDTDE